MECPVLDVLRGVVPFLQLFHDNGLALAPRATHFVYLPN